MFEFEVRDTICALASAPGEAGISVIRISGPGARQLAATCLRSWPQEPQSHEVRYCFFHDPKSSGDGDGIIDEVMATYFAGRRSFTGEDTVEVSCHGSPLIVESILGVLTRSGARLARPGEFTFRAYINGRIDLVQAEAVLDLVQSRSRLAAQAALSQLKGGLSQRYESIENHLLWCAAQTEAWIDFAEEDLVPAEADQVKQRLTQAFDEVGRLRAELEAGRVLKSGLRAVIVGAPNAGKSSLFNALVGEDRSIVTDVPGTTRDLVQGELARRGLRLELVDTAGLRETAEKVERIGVERAEGVARAADFVMVLFDGSRGLAGVEAQIAELRERLGNDVLEAPGTLWVVNKSDLMEGSGLSAMAGLGSKVQLVSALTGDGVEALRELMLQRIEQRSSQLAAWPFKERHVEALQTLARQIQSAIRVHEEGLSPDLLGSELQGALKTLYELLGREFHEQVIDRIFREFCLGK